MRYTTKAEYGIVALLQLAQAPMGDPLSAKDIAANEGLSVEYVEKLLHRLKQAELVISKRGAGGGFSLAHKPEDINLQQVIEALDGSTYQTFCNPDVRENIVCNHSGTCGLSTVWNGLKDVIDDYLSGVTLAQLLEDHQAKVAHRVND
ncbi:MAG: Rrf2 family transcriptional regulator [Planctomycetes bacterium]|nr:Rrf2 family transcriptional regulator [Planctomycetota bacterium]